MIKPVSRFVVEQIAYDLTRERETSEMLRAKLRALEAELRMRGVDPRTVLGGG